MKPLYLYTGLAAIRQRREQIRRYFKDVSWDEALLYGLPLLVGALFARNRTAANNHADDVAAAPITAVSDRHTFSHTFSRPFRLYNEPFAPIVRRRGADGRVVKAGPVN